MSNNPMYGLLGKHIQDLIRPPRRLPGAKPVRQAPSSSAGAPRPLRDDERPLGDDARRSPGGHPREA